jgi:hypothetical protein
VSSVRSRNVACAKGPNVRRFEHFLQLLDIVNGAFNVHASQYPTERQEGQLEAAGALAQTEVR